MKEKQIILIFSDVPDQIQNLDLWCLNNLIDGDDFSEFEVKNGNNVYLRIYNAVQHFRIFEFLHEFFQLQKKIKFKISFELFCRISWKKYL